MGVGYGVLGRLCLSRLRSVTSPFRNETNVADSVLYDSAASSDHTARLWELASGTTVRQYSAHHKACVCVALNDSSS